MTSNFFRSLKDAWWFFYAWWYCLLLLACAGAFFSAVPLSIRVPCAITAVTQVVVMLEVVVRRLREESRLLKTADDDHASTAAYRVADRRELPEGTTTLYAPSPDDREKTKASP